jgi:SAM-dependent methyltransferase
MLDAFQHYRLLSFVMNDGHFKRVCSRKEASSPPKGSPSLRSGKPSLSMISNASLLLGLFSLPSLTASQLSIKTTSPESSTLHLMPKKPSPRFTTDRIQPSEESFIRERLSYPTELIDKVIAATGLTGSHSVLDLGCGDGLLGISFAPHVKTVVGVDLDPAILKVAAAYAREAGVSVTFKHGTSFHPASSLGKFHLVAVRASYQGLDWNMTLDALERIVPPLGALALFGASHPEIPQNLWHKRLLAGLRPFARNDPAHHSPVEGGKSFIRPEFFLLKSKFNRLERVSVIQQIESPVETVLHRTWSMSNAASPRLDSEMKTVLENLREILNQQATNGMITEVIESQALLAFRRAT